MLWFSDCRVNHGTHQGETTNKLLGTSQILPTKVDMRWLTRICFNADPQTGQEFNTPRGHRVSKNHCAGCVTRPKQWNNCHKKMQTIAITTAWYSANITSCRVSCILVWPPARPSGFAPTIPYVCSAGRWNGHFKSERPGRSWTRVSKFRPQHLSA
jgi:hypothetical protein